MIEFHIGNSNNAVLDMLNVKYFFQGGEQGLVLRENPSVLGTSWFVKDINVVENRDEEIRSMGKIFKIINKGKGSLWVNNEQKSTAEIRGFEKVNYLYKGDTLNVPLSNGIRKGLKVVFVMDVKGETSLVPEFTLTADTANSFTRLVDMEVSSEFQPSEQAFIAKENAEGVNKKTFTGVGEIKMDAYSPMKLTYSSESDREQFAVFSEIFYDKGWKASIDGKEAKIYNVNYCLRGLKLPKGKHKIEFVYDSGAYDSSNSISFVLCCLVLAFVGFCVWKQRKEDQGEADSVETTVSSMSE
ncbi:MAG: YfhO family protein [Crocinitomicaceae bacterium]|nr:YfhO family protein [Crocinitomicaceae bacterium]